jgi:hypothetical protein
MLRDLILLTVAIERDPRRLCAFTGRLRVSNTRELLEYLNCLVALGDAVEAA